MELGTYDLHDLAIWLVKQGQGPNYVIVREVLHESITNNDETSAEAELIIASSLDPYFQELREALLDGDDISIKDNVLQLRHVGDAKMTTTYTFHSLRDGDLDRFMKMIRHGPTHIDPYPKLYQAKKKGPH